VPGGLGDETLPLDQAEELLAKVNDLHEANPMLGLRGVRLGILKPGLYAMQVRAILEAAAKVKADGGNPIVEIMIPLAATREELAQLREELEPVARRTLEDKGQELEIAADERCGLFHPPFQFVLGLEDPRDRVLRQPIDLHEAVVLAAIGLAGGDRRGPARVGRARMPAGRPTGARAIDGGANYAMLGCASYERQ
jgi:hypothetical protein